MKVITFSRTFPKYHPKAGQPTYFVEKIVKSLHLSGLRPWDIPDEIFSKEMYYIVDPKGHTIRAGNRWRVGDKFSPRVWSGKPYASKQIQFAVPIEIKKIWDIKFVTEDDDGEHDWDYIEAFGKRYTFYGYGGYDKEEIQLLAKNDGLSVEDLKDWMCPDVSGRKDRRHTEVVKNCQIICWNEEIEY